MKKSISLVLIAVLLTVLLAGCGGAKSGTTEVSKPKIAYYAINSEPYVDFDPRVEYSNGILVLHNVYETLTRYNSETEEVEPLLAESWSKNDDGTVWTFKIRKDVKFHDGALLNAEAVKKSIDKVIELNMGAAYIWSCVKEINVVDENTVEFVLNYAAPLDYIASSGYASFIVSPNVVDKDNAWFNEGNAAGTGPYKVQKVTKGEEVILAKFDEYWKGWKENQYDNVIIKKSAESSSRRQLVEKGDAQITQNLSITDVKALKSVDGVEIVEGASWRTVSVYLNTEKKPMDNVDFRRALNYAFPYDETINDVKDGVGLRSYGLVPQGLWGHDESLVKYEYDMDKAAEYLKKSGVNTEGLELEMTFTAGSEDFRNMAQLFQVNLKKLGIDLQIREMNWDNVWEKSKSTNPEDRQDMLVMYWWPDYASPMSWFYSLVHSEENISFNLSYINDKNLDSMIESADMTSATNIDEASKILSDVQKEVLDKAYFINAFDDKSVWAVNSHFKGFKPNPAYDGVVFFYDTYQE